MNEIEKMYENAGVEPEINYVCDKEPCEQHSVDCQKCSHLYDTREDYPDFAAEKQFELLKICFEKYERLEKVRGLKERCIIYYRFDTDGYTEFVNCETWEETIAGLINNLWQDLTEKEKRQVKEILE